MAQTKARRKPSPIEKRFARYRAADKRMRAMRRHLYGQSVFWHEVTLRELLTQLFGRRVTRNH
jgi:hypothetical protein